MMDSKIDKEIFHQEMGTLIYYFSNIIELVNYDTKELLVFYVLIKKIIYNASAANLLIYEDYINEAKIVLRSAIETIILITYLSKFPDKIDEYLDDSQILRIKNNFMGYKNIKEGEICDITGHKYTKEELSLENERCFECITPTAKEKILKGIGLENFEITEDNFKQFDKYFRKVSKPQFMNYEKMHKELENFKIIGDYEFTLRDIIYSFYNDSSQITHGCFFDWHHKIDFNQKEAEYLFSYFIKVTFLLKILLKDTVDMDVNLKTKSLIPKMQEAHNNLETLIYGQILQH